MGIVKHIGGSLQRRAARSDGWTKARRARFLDALATSCNARLAAAAVGLSVGGARSLRRRDPAFAVLWSKALDQGAQRLEEELLAYSVAQAPSDDNPDEERTEHPAVSFDAKAAMDFLKWRAAQSRPAGKIAEVTPEEVDLALMQRLDQLAKRLRKP